MIRKEANYCLTTYHSEQEKKATIITTDLSFDRWGKIVKDKVLVTAMVDRLTHKAHLVNMTGQSKETQNMRKNVQEK